MIVLLFCIYILMSYMVVCSSRSVSWDDDYIFGTDSVFRLLKIYLSLSYVESYFQYLLTDFNAPILVSVILRSHYSTDLDLFIYLRKTKDASTISPGSISYSNIMLDLQIGYNFLFLIHSSCFQFIFVLFHKADLWHASDVWAFFLRYEIAQSF